jgi:plasmid maintenance system antidote protein VapI
MKLSEQASVIRSDLGEFLRELAFIDRRWIRVNSCSNNTFLPHEATEKVDCPIDAFCDLLGVSAKKANEYLCAAKLLETHKLNKTLGPSRDSWEALISEFGLEMELEKSTDGKHLECRCGYSG